MITLIFAMRPHHTLRFILNAVCAITLCSLVATTSYAEISFGKGKGTSVGTAVVILGAENTIDGIGAENRWIKKNMPGWRKSGQSLVEYKGRMYDVIEIKKSGKTREVYFDITDFFGKF
jgi:hypothetical protein